MQFNKGLAGSWLSCEELGVQGKTWVLRVEEVGRNQAQGLDVCVLRRLDTAGICGFRLRKEDS